jgi:hypothetical protein
VAKAIVVLSFETEPEQLAEVLAKINPPSLPGFTGSARIAIGPEAKYVETWLDDGDPTSPDSEAGHHD